MGDEAVNKKRILAVDDEVSFTNLVKLILESTGEYEVRIENSGKKAVSAAREFRPDLILLDIIMPDISGMEVASLLKEDSSLINTPVVFLTAIVTEKEVEAQKKLGEQVFIAKPIAANELIECIEKNIKK